VDGRWRWSETRANVLFLHFEDMKRDLPATVDRVAAFLDVALAPADRDTIAGRCAFDYMKAHEEFFEMAPPTMFSATGGEFMASGKEKRHEDVSPAVKAKIAAYCRTSLRDAAYPYRTFYPDLAG
jgi:hypothetical protein